MAKKPQTAADEAAAADAAAEPPVDLPEPQSAPVPDVADAQAAPPELEVPPAKPDPATAAAPRAEPLSPQPPPPRSGWGPALMVAFVLAALAVGAGYLLMRQGGPLDFARVQTLATDQDRLAADIGALRADVDSMGERLAADDGAARIDQLTQQAQALQTALDEAEADRAALRAEVEDLQAAIEELRRRPAEVEGDALSEQAVAAYERELAAMREMFQAELDRIRADSQAAVEAAQQASRAGASAEALAALSEVNVALDTGTRFSAALDRLESLDANLPVAPLRPHAEGVVTLAELQRTFPAAARAALAADSATATEPGLGGFLKAQLGMRSLSPREGEGTDAVLSRAESLLRQGDLRGALAELDTLPEAAAAALAEWRGRGTARLEAQAAYRDLARGVQG